MGASPEIIQSKDVMTPERLREHLFGGPQVPFWNYDPTQLTIGIEVEYFIAHLLNNGNFKLATKLEYLQVIEFLKARFGYLDHGLKDQPGRVSRDTEKGFIAIKPDFAWHILEISFPPRGNLDTLRTMIDTVFVEVDTALAGVGLVRLDISALPDVPENLELVELDRLAHISETFISDPNIPTAIPTFPALITATHVHLNICREKELPSLERLFLSDEAVQKRFTRPTYFRGQFYENLRNCLYRDTFGPDYLMRNTPKTVPTDLRTMSDMMNQSRQIFVMDRFFPVRNMASIRPTTYGTFEFRSSCSFKSVDIVLQIVRERISQAVLANRDQVMIASKDKEKAAAYMHLLSEVESKR